LPIFIVEGFFPSLVFVDTVLFYISLKISSPTYYLLQLYYDTTFFPFFQVDFFAIGLIDKIMENQLIGKDLIHCNLHCTRDQYKNKRKNMSRDLSFFIIITKIKCQNNIAHPMMPLINNIYL